VRDAGSGEPDPIALASGDFVFVGDVGRPDLLETAAGAVGSMEPAARTLYRSIQKDFKSLPEFLQIWPAHGAGSACGKSLGDVPVSTVGYELRTNVSIKAGTDEASFVEFILSGQPEPPLYFARMKRDNRSGPKLLAAMPTPRQLDVVTLQALAHRRDVVVLDTRSRDEFLSRHLPGSILADLDFQFCTIAGSYVAEEAAVYLIVDEDRRDEAVLALVRIGIDRIDGYATPATLDTLAQAVDALVQTEVIDFQGLEARRLSGQARVVDVRSKAEYDLGHVPEAINIPHTRLPVRLAELPKDQPFVVHCLTGGRAAAAVSFLERSGYRAAVVNGPFSDYRPIGEAAKATA